MGIKSAVKKVIQTVTDKVEEYRDDKAEDKELMKCKSLLEKAMAEHQIFRSNAAAWDEQYNGTHAVGRNIGGNSFVSNRFQSDQSAPNVTPKDARQVVNITGQLIEAQIDITVPEPAVEAIEGDDQGERQKMIEGKLCYMSKGADLMRINSENERIVKKNSICVYKVMYDPNHKEHKYIGLVKTSNPHPTNVIPQPGQYRVKDMDRMWHIENRTVDQICRMYGDQYKEDTGRELRDDIEDKGSREFNYLEDFSATQETTDKVQEKYSVIEQYYKDEDNDVGVYTWCGMVKIRKLDKFFYKRDEKGEVMYTEDVDIQVPAIDPSTGQPAMSPNGQPQVTTKTVQVECHVPKDFPFVIQYNIPKEKTYYGKSDPEIIFDQQEGIKKMLSIEEEKLIKGTTKIVTRKGSKLKDALNNATMQVVETDNPQADMIVVQMHTNEQSYKDLYQIYVQAAKDQLGVTDASQGHLGGADLSGKAIDSLAAYSQGRMGIKQFEKNIAYTELYRLWYDFVLAYYDEKRPYRTDGPENKPIFGYFDKGKLVKQDDAGDWYYPPFDIMIRTDSGLPKDKKFVVESANKAGDRMDNMEYWMVMDSVGFPNAGAILDREREKEQNAQNNQPPVVPNISAAFKDMPSAAKIQALAKDGITITMDDIINDPAAQQAQPQEPIDPHTPALELTKMHIDQQNEEAKRQHDLQKIALQTQASAALAEQKHQQSMQTLGAKAQVDAGLNEQRAQHAAVAVKDKPKGGENK